MNFRFGLQARFLALVSVALLTSAIVLGILLQFGLGAVGVVLARELLIAALRFLHFALQVVLHALPLTAHTVRAFLHQRIVGLHGIHEEIGDPALGDRSRIPHHR